MLAPFKHLFSCFCGTKFALEIHPVFLLFKLQGNDGSAGAPRNRIGQISHSVVLGTLNVGDQGEGVVSDLTRVCYL